jgi:hypothetical protein
MYNRLSKAERLLLDDAENMRGLALTALADSRMQASIGEKRAARLRSLARKAGVIMMTPVMMTSCYW